MNTRTALISGGTQGIGLAVTKQFLSEGFNVAVFSRKNEHCKDCHEELAKNFDEDQILVLQGDVTDEESVRKIVEETILKFDTIDLLVNNAGIGYFSKADDVDVDRYKQMIDVNLVGMAVLTKHVVPHMKKQESGSIVNISSTAGKSSNSEGELYSATKFGVVGYSEGIRQELKPFGIKVAVVYPGMTDTTFFENNDMQERFEKRLKETGALIEVDEIANIVSLIANQKPSSNIQEVLISSFRSK